MNNNRHILFFYLSIFLFIILSLFIDDFLMIERDDQEICREQFGPGDYSVHTERIGLFKKNYNCRRLIKTNNNYTYENYTYERGF